MDAIWFNGFFTGLTAVVAGVILGVAIHKTIRWLRR
jgi:hypothetical protein